MTEVWFYQLGNQPVERVLPILLEKSLERGWRATVEVGSVERMESLDSLLWTYREESFLPHGTSRESDSAHQPVLLTAGSDNANRADVRFLLDGVTMPTVPTAYKRIAILFNADDEDMLEVVRQRFAEAKANGLDTTYWRMDAEGRWRREESGAALAR